MRKSGGYWAVIAMAVAAVGCKKADEARSKPKAPPAAIDAAVAASRPAPQKKVSLSPAANSDLTAFAPFKDDHVAVLIRYDRLRNTPLGVATERLLSYLPDHRRVVGSTGTNSLEVFDLLLITSAHPSEVTATNMAAYRKYSAPKLRKLLDNDFSPVKWFRTQGGAAATLKETTQFPYPDPRWYMMPLDKWIVMVDPSHLGALHVSAAGELDAPVDKSKLPGWIRRLPSLFQVGDKRLVALASLNKFPATIRVPFLGTLPAPRRTTIALEQHGAEHVWSGLLHFTSEDEAKRFANAMQGAGFLLSASGLLPRELRAPAAEAFRTLALRHKGKQVRWSARMATKNGAALTDYAATLVDNWARGLAGWSFKPGSPDPKGIYPPHPTKPAPSAPPARSK